MSSLKTVSVRKIWQRAVSFAFFAVAREFFASLPKITGHLPSISCAGKIRIGRRCILRSLHSRQVITVFEGAVLEIGDDAFMNDGVNICASVEIRIGKFVKIGDMTYIYDTDFHEVSPEAHVKKKPVVIGNNVWIGANCMILAGSVIGDHSVIAAGSIVSGDIPPRCVAAGIPATVKRSFAAPDGWVRS